MYGSVSDADAYHEARGNSGWTGDNTAKEVALLRGSEYVDYSFRARFPGWKAGLREQTREWPRTWAYDIEDNAIASDVVPVEVEHAAYEAALRELEEPGALTPDYTASEQAKREKVGPIEVEYAGAVGVSSVRPIITIIGGILAPVLTGGPASSIAGRSARI